MIDCPLEVACVDGTCAAPECDDDTDCAEDSRCLAGDCVESGCRSKNDCPDQLICQGTPSTCQPPPEECRDDADCPSGRSCWPPTSSCRDLCESDAACSTEQYCGASGICRPECGPQTPCRADETCVDTRCEALPDCSDEPDCTARRAYRDPLTCDCVECLRNDHCDVSAAESCSPDGRCLVCPATVDDVGDCSSQGLMRDGMCCVACVTDSDCDDPPYCHNGRCVALRPDECAFDGDCADGEICDRGSCAPEASFQDCTLQTDCPGGEACYPDGRCHSESAQCSGCPDPSRCVADPGGANAQCVGCQNHCSPSECPSDAVCVVEDGQTEGFCLDESLAISCR